MPASQISVSEAVIDFYDYRLDRNLRRLSRNGEHVKISRKLFGTLEFLIINTDRVVSKDELLGNVWQGEHPVRNTVEQVVTRLRRQFADDPANPQFIETVPGQGYRFIAPLVFPVSEASPDPDGGEPDPLLPNQIDRILTSATLPAGPGQPAGATANWRSKRLRWTKYLAAASMAAVAAGIFLYATAPGEPASCEITVNTLIVKDGQGREVWRRAFGEHFDSTFYAARAPLCRFADLDRDRVDDVLFSARPAGAEFESDILYGFITRSRVLRRLRPSPARTLTFKPGAPLVVGPNSDPTTSKPYDEYLPPYQILGIFPEKAGNGSPRIIVASAMNQAPNQIAVLDSRLNKVSEYWHAGELKYGQFATYEGRDRIFFAGVNNGYHSATLVVFDPANINGTTDLSVGLPDRTPLFAILAAGTKAHLSRLGAGTETCRVIFERTCVARAKPYWEPYNRAINLKVTEDRIIVTVAEGESEETPATVVYEMDRHLNLIEAAPNTRFRQRHFELEKAGLLDHAFSLQELKPLIHVLPGCEFVQTAQKKLRLQ